MRNAKNTRLSEEAGIPIQPGVQSTNASVNCIVSLLQILLEGISSLSMSHYENCDPQ